MSRDYSISSSNMSHQLSRSSISPVGVLDSGVGGLSVLRQVADLLPDESLLYVADSAYAPYGERSPQWIRERAMQIGLFLQQQGAKALVVACNTATAAAVPLMRESFDIPVIGMEPAIKPAAVTTGNGRIGVLATTGTLESARFAALLDRYAREVRVFARACVGWVEAVEAGKVQGREAESRVKEHVVPLIAEGVDTLILGCTHYPFLTATIEKVCKEESTRQVSLIETGGAVAQRLKTVLDQQGLLRRPCIEVEAVRPTPSSVFYSSANIPEQKRVMQQLWGRPLQLQALPSLSGGLSG